MKKPVITLAAATTVVFATIALVSCFDRSTGGKWEASSAKVAADDIDLDKLPKETFKLLPPPQVPPPITRKSPARVAADFTCLKTQKIFWAPVTSAHIETDSLSSEVYNDRSYSVGVAARSSLLDVVS